MKNVKEFAELLAKQARELMPIQTVWAVAKSVDWDTKTMVATGQTDNLDYEEVLLGNGFEYKKPKQGTICLLGIIQNNGAMAYLIDAVEVEEYQLIIDKSLFKQSLNGFTIKKENETLKKILQDLMVEVNKLNVELQKVVVSVGVTPNVPVLQNIQNATTAISNRVNNLMEE